LDTADNGGGGLPNGIAPYLRENVSDAGLLNQVQHDTPDNLQEGH
jgi:hypothetical protein